MILQEIGQANDTPDDIVFDWLQEAAYPGQPMGRSILGPAERVREFSRDDLSGFVGERYGPGQMIVAAAGSVDHDKIVRSAERIFGGLEERVSAVVEPARFGGTEIRRDKPLEQVHFTFGVEVPGYRDPSLYTSQIYASLLGGGMSSRLFQEVREARGLCYSIFAQAGAYADSGLMTIYAGTGAEDIRELSELTTDIMRRSADDITPEEVARARAQMKAGLLMGLENASSRAERIARLLSIWNRVPDLEETVERIDAVTTGDVREFAAQLAARGEAAMALYGPVSDAPDLEALAGRLAGRFAA